MEIINLKEVGEKVYHETLDNGLNVYAIRKKDFSLCTAHFITKFGGLDLEFVPINEDKMTKFPAGIAHFLEHKLFEQESGEDPFAFYTKNGADANANTSHQKTTYLFSGTGNLEKNLKYLLDFVQKPYFTDENVEKEKGIIEQEIKMYDDVPYWKLYDSTLNNAFHVHPLKYPIAGTVETINKITKDDLYTCYNTFYHPSNMFLTIVGNFDPEKVIKTIRSNQKKKKYLFHCLAPLVTGVASIIADDGSFVNKKGIGDCQ